MDIGRAVFKYKTVKGPLHRVSAVIKLLLLLPVCLLCMPLNVPALLVCITLAVFASFACGFSLADQITDLRPAFYYALLMYALSVFSNLTGGLRPTSLKEVCALFIPGAEYLRITLRLALVIQISALFFRTTSPLEIRSAVRLETVSLFMCFIPEIFRLWAGVNLAWKSRGGREGFSKAKTLSFVLISAGFERAAAKARAIEARSFYERKN